MKDRIDKLDFITIKIFCSAKKKKAVQENKKTSHRLGQNICKDLIKDKICKNYWN
jgi:hypothetical protein